MTADGRIGHTATVLLATLLTMFATAPVEAEHSRCAAIELARQRIDVDPGATDAIIGLLPGPLSERAATEAGRTDRDGVIALVTRAAALTCPPSLHHTDDSVDRASLQALLDDDPRFGGLRADGSLGDRLLEKLWQWLEALLESETMQRFSDHTRTIYLSLLGAFGSLLAFRLWRRSGSRRDAAAHDDVTVGVERVRRLAFDRCRQDALAAIDVDPRIALLHLRRALLVRVGELDEGAVVPSRTSLELLARLTPDLATVVRPALDCFDSAFFGGHPTSALARALLAAVDHAHATLKAARPSSSAPSSAPSSSSTSTMRSSP